MYLDTWPPHDNCMQIPRHVVDMTEYVLYVDLKHTAHAQRLNNDRLVNYHYQFIFTALELIQFLF